MWIAALVLLPLATEPAQGLRLTGHVRGPDGPLPGATVYVAAARPRRGVGVL